MHLFLFFVIFTERNKYKAACCYIRSLTSFHIFPLIFNNFLHCADKLAKALPEIEEIAKLLPDFDKIGENFTFLKSLLSSGE